MRHTFITTKDQGPETFSVELGRSLLFYPSSATLRRVPRGTHIYLHRHGVAGPRVAILNYQVKKVAIFECSFFLLPLVFKYCL